MRRFRSLPARDLVWGLVLPVVALALLVVALAGPHLQTGANRPTILAVDQSASVDARMRTVELQWTRHVGTDNCVMPCRIIRFAATADARGAAARGTSTSGINEASTDLQTAIRTAIGLTPNGGRVVVLSDGGQTQGDALATTALARSRHVEIDWVPLTGARSPDAAMTAIKAPPAVRVGDTVPLALTVHSTVAGEATLQVRRDGGKPASQTIYLAEGDNPLLLFYTATRQGWQSFDVSISLAGDQAPANDSLAAVTYVASAPRVLAVGSPGSAVPKLLAGHRLRVTAIQPAVLPVSAAAYTQYDAAVLDDVPATQLTAAQISALKAAVRNGGLGLTVVGGPHSFSLGRYWQSPLQQILPVSSLVPGNLERRNLAIEMVLDRSGSMVDLAGGVPKIVMVRAAARQSAAFIAAHRDELGIVDFDIAPHLLVPIQTVTPGASERRTDRTIASLQANGGTNIFAGLQAGLAQILKSTARVRHVILMTDGISAPANYEPLFRILLHDHISVATVALGSDADRPLLKAISTATGGHAYVTDDAKQLPHIFVKETQLAAKPVRVTGHLKVGVSSDSPVVRSLVGERLPPLSGNVVVSLKNGAQADLVATGKGSELDPALAEWQVGAGRVVTWTPGLGPPWASAWLGKTSLWNDAVRWSERGATPPPLTPTLSGDPGTLQIDLADAGAGALGVTGITGTLTASGTPPRPIAFEPVAPGLYQANVASFPEGVYRFQLATQGAGQLRATGEIALPYPAEYSPVPVMTSPMGQLVAQTGGRVLATAKPDALTSTNHSLRLLLTLLALLAFLVSVGGRMLPTLPGGWRRKASEPPATEELDREPVAAG
jgi:Ca-activated chloride channel homolog